MPDLLLDYTDIKRLDLFQVIVTISHIVQTHMFPQSLTFQENCYYYCY